MASTIHAAPPPYPTPSFSRSTTASSLSGIHFSQPSLNPFDTQQSVASTPTATPPPRGHQPHMSFNVGSYGPPNGVHMQQGGSRAYGELNGTMLQQQYPPGQKPQIYTVHILCQNIDANTIYEFQAVYSGVSVYEMEVNNVAVMRRRADSWLNATQILKVAGIDKGKRTKVLEKEILAGEHEKVQGGYGKYQGTWINYQRGVEFCRQYGVEELLRPLLEYDMGQDGVNAAGKGGVDTPTKEQAMAAQRKRLYNGGVDHRPPAQSPNGTFFKNISSTAANAVNAMSKARFDSPVPRPGSGNRRPVTARRPSQQMVGSQESAYPGSSQQSMQSMHSETSFGMNGQLEPAFESHNTPYFLNDRNQDHNFNGEMQEPPRKRARPSSSQGHFSHNMNGDYDISMRETTPTEPNESFVYHKYGLAASNVDPKIVGLPPLPQPTTDTAMEKQQLLTSLFLDPSQTDFSNHPAFLRLSGEELDIPIDPTAHTALHWAATLARTSLLRALISKGASIYRLNGGGETALIRAALTTNNLDQVSFPDLLELLGPTIEMRDGRGRTVLHHIAVSSAVKGRSPACRYYLESLLEFVVRQGSAPSSQQNFFTAEVDRDAPTATRSIGLARFMSEIVNATDMSGDTALNLAARIGNKSITQQLLEVGANPTIPNRGGLKPVDFGVGGEPEHLTPQPSSQVTLPTQEKGINKVGETSRDIMASISTLLSEAESSFKSELQTKQSLLDQTHAKLRECTTSLHEERRRLSDLERKSTQRKDIRQKITNLRRANEEQRLKFSLQLSPTGHPHPVDLDPRTDVKVGEADAGLEIDPASLPERMDGLLPEHIAYVTSLPPARMLSARAAAYEHNNSGLGEQAKALRARSSELEDKLRRVVAICTGVEEGAVDAMVGGLVVAVESERGEDVEVGRVRDFLRRVEGVEA